MNSKRLYFWSPPPTPIPHLPPLLCSWKQADSLMLFCTIASVWESTLAHWYRHSAVTLSHLLCHYLSADASRPVSFCSLLFSCVMEQKLWFQTLTGISRSSLVFKAHPFDTQYKRSWIAEQWRFWLHRPVQGPQILAKLTLQSAPAASWKELPMFVNLNSCPWRLFLFTKNLQM